MIQRDGFSADQIGTIAGASGGAKWLVLSQLDRVVIDRILPILTAPVHLVGSSIGSWRFACYAQEQPLEAIDRFEEAYLEQGYSENPDIHEISARSEEILAEILGENGASEILSHPVLRTHVITVRARSLTASERPFALSAGLVLAAAANVISRKSLGFFFVRSIFYDDRDPSPFYNIGGFPLEQTVLTPVNLGDSIRASGAIPLVLNGVRNIVGATPGIYRDGGIIDYHLDIPTSVGGKLTLFPHFYGYLKPGWFDKKLSWRQNRGENVDRTVLIAPSDEFVANLPNGKIPDRTDFQTMSPELRRKVWRSVVSECRRMADEFSEVLEKDQLPERLQAL